MKRSQPLLLFFITLMISPAVAHAQAWSGLISPSRAIDWSTAGVVGGIPSAGWTQCGSTLPASSTAAAITAALAACAGTNQYVLLGPGTGNWTETVIFPAAGHVVLRGSGANSTFINITSGSYSGCALHTSAIKACGSNASAFGNPLNVQSWTAGYAKASNQLTVGSVAGISTADPPTLLYLEQCETGYTAASAGAACTGSAVDNGQLFICTDPFVASPQKGCSTSGTANQNAKRGHWEGTTVTSIAGSVLTIADPLIYPDYATGQTPRMWTASSISTVGVENISFDNTVGAVNDFIHFMNSYDYWVKGCKFAHWAFWGVETFQGIHGTITDNYFTDSTGVDTYGVRFEGATHNLIQNNIFIRTLSAIVFDGPSAGNVVGYNLALNAGLHNNFMKGLFFSHDQNAYDLYEGNLTNAQWNDSNHGTSNMLTRFRNLFLGWSSCGNGQCGANVFSGWTNPFIDLYGDRYQNNIANALCTLGYHNTYKSSAGTLGSGNGQVCIIAGTGFNPMPGDPLVPSTSMFYANYDVVTGAVRFCGSAANTGWAGVCGSASEVPTGASTYPNSLPTVGDVGAGQGALPASLYLASKPSWFGALPYPAIGPDVSSGSVGVCSGVLNTTGQQAGMPATNGSQCPGTSLTASAWGGHVSAIPALNCYLNVMGGLPDGTGSPLNFNASACYGGSVSSQGPNPPTNLIVVVN
jgi:hypothetical protein